MRRPDLYATIDGTSSDIEGCWFFSDLLVLEQDPEQMAAEPVHVAGANGTIAGRMLDDGTERVIEGMIYGRRDPDGDPYDSEWVGCADNARALRAAWGGHPDNDDNTRELVLHVLTADGMMTRTGAVQVREIAEGRQDMPTCIKVSVRLYIPHGKLGELESGS